MLENVSGDRQQKIVKHSAEKQPKTSQKRLFAYSMRILRIFYGYSMISLPVRHLELSAYEGTKKLRETSDIVQVLPKKNTKDTKIKIYMKFDGI